MEVSTHVTNPGRRRGDAAAHHWRLPVLAGQCRNAHGVARCARSCCIRSSWCEIRHAQSGTSGSRSDREEKRFGSAYKDKDGKVAKEELLAPRHKAFAKLDLDRNGMLSFDEWAAKTINKFEGADDDKNGTLTALEYAETAPKPKHHSVRCT